MYDAYIAFEKLPFKEHKKIDDDIEIFPFETLPQNGMKMYLTKLFDRFNIPQTTFTEFDNITGFIFPTSVVKISNIHARNHEEAVYMTEKSCNILKSILSPLKNSKTDYFYIAIVDKETKKTLSACYENHTKQYNPPINEDALPQIFQIIKNNSHAKTFFGIFYQIMSLGSKETLVLGWALLEAIAEKEGHNKRNNLEKVKGLMKSNKYFKETEKDDLTTQIYCRRGAITHCGGCKKDGFPNKDCEMVSKNESSSKFSCYSNLELTDEKLAMSLRNMVNYSLYRTFKINMIFLN